MRRQRFRVIYADPPWYYQDQLTPDRKLKYSTMSLSELCALPVRKIAAPNSTLFLWVTMPQLPVCFDVFTAWGFTYKTCAFTWVKRNRKKPSWFWGMGHWTRANAELCLLGVRGKPRRASAAVHSIVDSPIRGHSQKPSIVRERIVELCGDVSRVELFARNKSPGWSVWGNEVESDRCVSAVLEGADK